MAINDPTDIADLKLWLDYRDLKGTSDGAAISTWTDRSSTSRDLTQGTTDNQPSWSATNNSVVFEGNNYLSTTTADTQGLAGVSMVALVKRNTTLITSDSYILSSPDAGNLLEDNPNGLTYRSSGGGILSPEDLEFIDEDFFELITVTFETGASPSCRWFKNGVQIPDPTGGISHTIDDSGWTVGANSAGSSGLNGEVKLALVYHKILTSTEVSDIWDWVSENLDVRAERIYPDAILADDGYSLTADAVQHDPDGDEVLPASAFDVGTANTDTARGSFSSPTVTLKSSTQNHQIKAVCRANTNNSSALTYDLELWESGSFVKSTTSSSLAAGEREVVKVSFENSEISDTSGAGLEWRIVPSASSGDLLEIGGVELHVEPEDGFLSIEPTVISSTSTVASPTVTGPITAPLISSATSVPSPSVPSAQGMYACHFHTSGGVAFPDVAIVGTPSSVTYRPDASEVVEEDQGTLTGTWADVDDDPDSPDANWIVGGSSGNNHNSYTIDFSTDATDSSDDLDTGVDSQEIKGWFRTSGGGGGETVDLQLVRTDNSTVLASTGATGITNTTGEMLTLTFDGADVPAGLSLGSDVEIRCVVVANSSGSPNNRGTVDIGALEWNANVLTGGTSPSDEQFLGARPADACATIFTPSLSVGEDVVEDQEISPAIISAQTAVAQPTIEATAEIAPSSFTTTSVASPTVNTSYEITAPHISSTTSVPQPSVVMTIAEWTPAELVGAEALWDARRIDQVDGSQVNVWPEQINGYDADDEFNSSTFKHSSSQPDRYVDLSTDTERGFPATGTASAFNFMHDGSGGTAVFTARMDLTANDSGGILSNGFRLEDVGFTVGFKNSGGEATIYATLSNGSGSQETVDGPNNLVPDSNWHTYAVAIESSSVSFYRDGALVETVGFSYSLASGDATTDLKLGARYNNSAEYMHDLADAFLHDGVVAEADLDQYHKWSMYHLMFGPTSTVSSPGVGLNVVVPSVDSTATVAQPQVNMSVQPWTPLAVESKYSFNDPRQYSGLVDGDPITSADDEVFTGLSWGTPSNDPTYRTQSQQPTSYVEWPSSDTGTAFWSNPDTGEFNHLHNTNTWSISATFRWTGTPVKGSGHFVSTWDNDLFNEEGVSKQPTSLQILDADNGYSDVRLQRYDYDTDTNNNVSFLDAVPADGGWHTITLNCSSSSLDLYIDGELFGSETPLDTESTTTLLRVALNSAATGVNQCAPDTADFFITTDTLTSGEAQEYARWSLERASTTFGEPQINLSVAADHTASSTTVQQPTLEASYEITAAHFGPASTVEEPAVIFEQFLEPTLGAAATTVAQPSLATVVAPVVVSATTSVAEPTVEPGAVEIATAVITADTAVAEPSVDASYEIATTIVAISVAIPEPSLEASYEITAPHMPSTTTVEEPALVDRIEPTIIDASATFGTTTVEPGGVEVAPSAFTTTSVAQPAVEPGQVELSPITFTAETTVAQPTLEVGQVEVAPSPIGPVSTFGEPQLDLSVQAQIGAAETDVFEPVVESDLVVIEAPHIEAATSVAEPVVGAILVPTLIDTSTTFGTATVEPGQVEVSPSLASPATAVGQPQLDTGEVTVGAQHFSTTALQQPVVEAGEVTISVTKIDIQVLVEDPQVDTGVVEVAPPTFTTTSVNEPVVGGVIAPSLFTTTSVAQPQLDTGEITVEPQPIAASTTVDQPTVEVGTVEIAPANIVGTSIAEPTVETGVVEVAPDAIAATTVAQPQVGLGIAVSAIAVSTTFGSAEVGLSVESTSVDSTLSVPAPILSASSEVLATHVGPTSTISSPSLSVGQTEIAPSVIDVSPQVSIPTLDTGGVSVITTLVAADTEVGQPTIDTGEVEVAPSSIAPATTVAQPEVALSVGAAHVDSTTSVAEPTLEPGQVEVAPTAIASTATFGSPTLDQSIVAPHIASATEVGQPQVDQYAEIIHISPTTTVEEPSLQVGVVEIAPNVIALPTDINEPSLGSTLFNTDTWAVSISTGTHGAEVTTTSSHSASVSTGTNAASVSTGTHSVDVTTQSNNSDVTN